MFHNWYSILLQTYFCIIECNTYIRIFPLLYCGNRLSPILCLKILLLSQENLKLKKLYFNSLIHY